jgi:hypothetical protein
MLQQESANADIIIREPIIATIPQIDPTNNPNHRLRRCSRQPPSREIHRRRHRPRPYPRATRILVAHQRSRCDLARSVARIALEEGFISSAEEETLDIQQARDQAGYEAASWGLNVRCRAIRLRKLLGWTPTLPSLEAELRDTVKGEWDLMQYSCL